MGHLCHCSRHRHTIGNESIPGPAGRAGGFLLAWPVFTLAVGSSAQSSAIQGSVLWSFSAQERIELARKRIDELILLIDTWKDNDKKDIHSRKEES